MPTPTTLTAPGRRRRARLEAARLYLICDANPGGRPLLGVLRAAIAGGVDIVQLREKHLDDTRLTAVAEQAAELCRELGALFVVNDRPAVALASGADGVHLGQDDTPVAEARGLLGADALIGLSTHAPDEIDAAERLAAAGDNLGEIDYIGVGPVHATPTKPGRPATGLSLVRHATAHTTLPFFAIGGIHAENAASVVDAGARRLAVVRAIGQAAEPERAARELRALLVGADAPGCASAPRP
ncbi:MAG TPA: thiamine phosphate synthase [Solirubrobacteraceae bacterium]|nr:thiamine phosphate synthase [Solirubrobacteraceae bacterium]